MIVIAVPGLERSVIQPSNGAMMAAKMDFSCDSVESDVAITSSFVCSAISAIPMGLRKFSMIIIAKNPTMAMM